MATPNQREVENSRWYRTNINDALLASNAGRQARTAAAARNVQRLAELTDTGPQYAFTPSLDLVPSFEVSF